MHCSHCGFENPAIHRFCGMCGTRLPQQPVLAPEARSTLSFSASTLEVLRRTSPTLSGPTPAIRGAALEEAASEPSTRAVPSAPPDATAPISDHPSGAPELRPEAEPASSPPVENYFTKAQEAESLEQFIAGFQYTPPSEEDEVDMTGEKPVLDGSGEYKPPEPASLSEEQAPVVQVMAGAEEPVVPMASAEEPAAPPITPESFAEQPPPFATKSLRAKAPEPARVPDLSVPVAKEVPGNRTSGSPGLSVLGLSDPAPVPSSEADNALPRRKHWWAWVSVIVILSLAALGFLEWRAETFQTSYGPISILKTELEHLRARKGAAVTTPAAPTKSSPQAAPAGPNPHPDTAVPELQSAPFPQPTTNPNPGNSPAPPANTPANQGSANPSAPVTH